MMRKIRWAVMLLMAMTLVVGMIEGAESEELNRTVYRAVVIGIDAYETPLKGCVNDANRMSTLLQAANEGGAFYQAPSVYTDSTEEGLNQALNAMAALDVSDNDVTFFFFAGACILNDKAERVGLITRDGAVFDVIDIEKKLAEVPGTKILVFSLVYPQNRIPEGMSASGAVSKANEMIINIIANGEGAARGQTNYALCFMVDSNTATLVNSVTGSVFGMPAYFLSQACGYDYQYERPCDLLADSNSDGAVSVTEALTYVNMKIDSFRATSGLSQINSATSAYPDGSQYPIVARRTNTDVVSVTLDRGEIELATDKSVHLSASVSPANATDKSILWTSSDLAVASVDQQGNVKALRAGDAVISATAPNGVSSFCTLRVRAVRKTESMTFDELGMTIATGGTAQLTPLRVPSGANDVLIWRSLNEAAVTVTQDGLVTGVGIGTSDVSVSAESGVSALITIEVVEPGQIVTKIELRNTSVSLYEGETAAMETRFTPREPANPSVSWKSADASVAEVADNGVITAIKAGETIITATASSGVTADCRVTVNSAKIEMAKTLELTLDKTAQIDYKITPATGNPSVTWTSSDEQIVTVDAQGKLTALSVGVAKIRATLLGGASAEMDVTVSPLPVTAIRLDKSSAKMTIGEMVALIPSLKPENADPSTLVWKSSDINVATVDGTGLVTAVGNGKAEISVTAPSGKAAVCKLTVSPILITKIELDKAELNLVLGLEGYTTAKLEATLAPDNASERGIVWKSNNDKVVKVDESGNVTAVAEGKTKIVAEEKDGGKVYAECKIAVYANKVENKKAEVGDKRGLYVSAKRIAYEGNELVVELYFVNSTKSALTLPMPGKLVLTLNDGTALTLADIPQGDKKLGSGKQNELAYRFDLTKPEYEAFKGLVLVGSKATIEIDPAALATPAPSSSASGTPAASPTPSPTSDFAAGFGG